MTAQLPAARTPGVPRVFADNVTRQFTRRPVARTLRLVSGLAVFALLAACVPHDRIADTPSSTKPQAREIDPALLNVNPTQSIRADVTWLADDARAGREAGSQGYDDAANWLADRLANLGVRPGNGDSYFQNVTLRTTMRDNDAAGFVITRDNGETITLENRTEYLSGASTDGKPFTVEGDLVFVGHGIVGGGYDDYAGLDVSDKIVVLFNGAPEDLNSEVRAHLGSGRTKARLAAARGARGMLTLSASTNDPELNWTRAIARGDRTGWGWVSPDGVTNDSDIAPAFQMGPRGAERLFVGSPQSFDEVRAAAAERTVESAFSGFDMPARVVLSGSGITNDLSSPNVVGLIEGSDPDLRNEVVVLSAHLDHVGTYEPRDGGDDHIHNGAMDNAMGIATLIDVARRFQRDGAPKRSILLVAFTAEEKGLIGSDYFAHYPTLDADRLMANVNLDMPLVLYPFTDVIAFGAERSTLGGLVRDAGAKMGVTLIDDPYPDLSLFVRSDHYNFVRQGIPSVFLFLGTGNGGQEVFETFMATNYHRPSDDVNLDISWQDAARFAELNYLIAREIAQSPEKPAWKDGDFFGSAAR